MESQRFDQLIAALTERPTRRGALRLLGGLALLAGVVSGGDAEAKQKRRKKKRKPTCTDGKRNGRETDVDCGGGTCQRCVDQKLCQVDNDCVSGTCGGGTCVTCSPSQLCGSDRQGSCQCVKSFPTDDPVCVQGQALGPSVQDCADCPAGTEICVTVNGLIFNCHKRCGSD